MSFDFFLTPRQPVIWPTSTSLPNWHTANNGQASYTGCLGFLLAIAKPEGHVEEGFDAFEVQQMALRLHTAYNAFVSEHPATGEDDCVIQAYGASYVRLLEEHELDSIYSREYCPIRFSQFRDLVRVFVTAALADAAFIGIG